MKVKHMDWGCHHEDEWTVICAIPQDTRWSTNDWQGYKGRDKLKLALTNIKNTKTFASFQWMPSSIVSAVATGYECPFAVAEK